MCAPMCVCVSVCERMCVCARACVVAQKPSCSGVRTGKRDIPHTPLGPIRRNAALPVPGRREYHLPDPLRRLCEGGRRVSKPGRRGHQCQLSHLAAGSPGAERSALGFPSNTNPLPRRAAGRCGGWSQASLQRGREGAESGEWVGGGREGSWQQHPRQHETAALPTAEGDARGAWVLGARVEPRETRPAEQAVRLQSTWREDSGLSSAGVGGPWGVRVPCVVRVCSRTLIILSVAGVRGGRKELVRLEHSARRCSCCCCFSEGAGQWLSEGSPASG